MVLGVSAYRSGNHFHPSDTERGFNANQVHFDDDQDVKGSDSTAEKDDSELWKQDSGADDTSDPQNDSSADFMFQRERIQENFSDPLSVAGGTAAPPSVQGGSIANTMQDPDSGKTGAGVIGEQDPSSKLYYEGNVDDSTVQEVVIQQPQNSS